MSFVPNKIFLTDAQQQPFLMLNVPIPIWIHKEAAKRDPNIALLGRYIDCLDPNAQIIHLKETSLGKQNDSSHCYNTPLTLHTQRISLSLCVSYPKPIFFHENP